MTEAANLADSAKVLEIGTGSGYQTAILARLCKEVYTVELVRALAIMAKKLLKDLGYNNIYTKIGNGYKGWTGHAPFDAIIVTAAPEEVPQTLVQQLKENGRLIIPLGDSNQQLIRITHKNLF